MDKDSIYKVNRQASIEEQLKDSEPLSQFGRAMEELNIEVIHAHSPQAKGRVERGFKTHQDRLVKELRLAGISTREAGNNFLWNRYLADHNQRCAVEPIQSNPAHRPLLASQCLEQILQPVIFQKIFFPEMKNNILCQSYTHRLYCPVFFLALPGYMMQLFLHLVGCN